jgi:hypothetical protein
MKKLTKHKKKIAMIIAIAAFVLIFENLLLAIRYNRINKYTPETIGVSFSQKQAERFDSDWKKNYLGLLDDLNFKNIRIPAYWDRIEPQKGQYDFSETDWMIEEAAKRNAKITLIIGQKNIRYPECYYPNWVDKNNIAQTSDQATEMVKAVAEHYKNSPTIKEWQLENEFLLTSFGECPNDLLTNKQLGKELAALKSVDTSKPVVFTQSDQFGFPAKGPFGNTFGFSMYRWSWSKSKDYWRYPQDGNYFWLKAGLINALFNQNIKIHELQAEAWGPIGNEYLSFEETYKTMNPKQFADNIRYVRETKVKNYDLWGAEWWWSLKQKGHPEMWDAVKIFMITGKLENN